MSLKHSSFHKFNNVHEDNDYIKHKISRIQEEQDAIKIEISNLKGDINVLFRQLRALQKENTRFDKTCQDMFREMDSLKHTNRKQEDELKDYKIKLNQLKDEIFELKKFLEMDNKKSAEMAEIKVAFKPWCDEIDKLVDEVFQKWLKLKQT